MIDFWMTCSIARYQIDILRRRVPKPLIPIYLNIQTDPYLATFSQLLPCCFTWICEPRKREHKGCHLSMGFSWC